MGYWASKNNMQEYKVYATILQVFGLDFVNNLWQALGDNMWPTKPTNYNYKTCLLCQVKYLLGMNKTKQYSLVETLHKKWLENESDFRWQQIWVAYFKIWWKLRCTGRTQRRNHNGWRGRAKNTIAIKIWWRRTWLRKHGWIIL